MDGKCYSPPTVTRTEVNSYSVEIATNCYLHTIYLILYSIIMFSRSILRYGMST